MAGKARSHTERLEKILDCVGEYIRNASGDELLDASREDGRDPAETSVHVKGILQNTFKVFQQKELTEAKQGYQRELACITQGNFRLPKTAEGRRNWFLAALAQAPQLLPAFTVQNRELTELSDHDIEAHLRNLASLGVLSAVRLPEEE